MLDLGHHPPFEMYGTLYRASRLSVLEQWQLFGELEPTLRGLAGGVGAASLAKALNAASDDEADRVLGALFQGVERQAGDRWEAVPLSGDDGEGGNLLIHEIAHVAVAATLDRLGRYFGYKPADIKSKHQSTLDWEQATLPNNMMFVLGPALRGMCNFESLVNGTLDLVHVAIMNDAIRCEIENKARAQAAAAAAAK